MNFFFKKKLLSLLVITVSMNAYTANKLAPNDDSVKQFNEDVTIEDSTEKLIDRQLPTTLNSEDETLQETMSEEESKAYLKNNPQQLEKILMIMLRQGNKKGLEELLPIYRKYQYKDQSVIDWGNAIIKARSGKLKEAIALYRAINAKLPNIKTLRFQMAMALFYDRQYDAAKSEFEKLRSSSEHEADVKAINKYLDAINSKGDWSLYANLSYLDDDNLSNAPKTGTKLVTENGSETTYTSPRESGKGFSYGLYGDKKWLGDDGSYAALNLDSRGNLYWNNKGFSDLSAGVGLGVGYQNITTEVEVGSFYNKRYYGGGSDGDSLKDYADVTGLKLNLSQWLNRQWRYRGLYRFSQSNYIDKYDYNDGNDHLLSNSLIYMPNQKQFWSVGTDYMNKKAADDSNSFNRIGARLGWGQTWSRGFSSNLNLGYAERDYKAENFFGIKRENKEYSAGLTLWNRGLHVFGLTPRLNLDYFEVTSNSPFEEYSKKNASLELTKTF